MVPPERGAKGNNEFEFEVLAAWLALVRKATSPVGAAPATVALKVTVWPWLILTGLMLKVVVVGVKMA